MSTGFFMDWDGNLRRVDDPGSGYTCEVKNAGINAALVPGGTSVGQPT